MILIDRARRIQRVVHLIRMHVPLRFNDMRVNQFVAGIPLAPMVTAFVYAVSAYVM